MRSERRRLLRPQQIELLRELVEWDAEKERSGESQDFLIVGGFQQELEILDGPSPARKPTVADFRELHLQSYLDLDQRSGYTYYVAVRPAAHALFEEAATATEAVSEPFPSAADADNAPLTPDEQTALSVQLREIRDFLLAMQHMADDRHAAVMREFNYLDKAGKRLGRGEVAPARENPSCRG